MLKYSLALSAFLGSCIAPCIAQDMHPIAQLQTTSRVLIVFAPDTNSVSFKRQFQLIERHAYELTERNMVVVPVSFAASTNEDRFPGENYPLASADGANARTRFHVKPSDFLVILLNQDGTEQMRSVSPVDIHQLTASLGPMPKH